MDKDNMLEEGTRVDRGYATVADDEGDNYRDIAETMSLMGYKMNHSSARNYVLRVMKKLVSAYASANSIELTEDKVSEVAKSPAFQNGVADLLHVIEGNRRLSEQNT
jgi:hypothetical protein